MIASIKTKMNCVRQVDTIHKKTESYFEARLRY